MSLKNLFFGQPAQGSGDAKVKWLERCVRMIETRSRDTDYADVARAFTLPTFTERRTFDPSTDAVEDFYEYVFTLISDMAKRGSKQES